ncbi:glutathione S-transferase [Halovulum dunhuangense]|uniref:Glutathione S-transferase n=1 Tax=Halovulum dunhuangense TaxID=1505036 RepID=A0A849L032_9RHOB|nr:glutathione S-transferase [Halovulum dunhuangense]NNU79000.1 glutathione S-transferase [Halovulum dunhuangense]
MKLYYSPTSPFVRKVSVVLRETGLIDKVTLVPGSGLPAAPGNAPIALNPLGKIPTLEREDGPALYDSRVICRYLDHISGGKLYPQPPRLWETLTLEATADGMMEAAVLMIYETRARAQGTQDPTWVEAQWSKVARALDTLEGRWIAYLEGPLDMGQIAVGCALGYLDFRQDARNWRGGHPALAEWYAGFAERDSMKATVPVG